MGNVKIHIKASLILFLALVIVFTIVASWYAYKSWGMFALYMFGALLNLRSVFRSIKIEYDVKDKGDDNK